MSFSLSEYTKVDVGWCFAGGDGMGEERRVKGSGRGEKEERKRGGTRKGRGGKERGKM